MGQVQFVNGYWVDNVFYDIKGEVSTLDDVTACVALTLKISVEKCKFIWGYYEYINPFTTFVEQHQFSGEQVDLGVWRLKSLTDNTTITFYDHCKKVHFSSYDEDITVNVLQNGYFKMVDGKLRKQCGECC